VNVLKIWVEILEAWESRSFFRLVTWVEIELVLYFNKRKSSENSDPW
jgi:hypothetical protein